MHLFFHALALVQRCPCSSWEPGVVVAEVVALSTRELILPAFQGRTVLISVMGRIRTNVTP